MNESFKTFRSAVLAGICIGIAGFGYLAEKSLAGSVLFCFGLLTVIHYGLRLYTGTAGFIRRGEVGMLVTVLAGNIIGCLLTGLLSRCSSMPLQETAQGIIQARLSLGALRCGLLAVGCGFIMTSVVTFARQGRNLPLLFGVPIFITCGFPHSIADAMYLASTPFGFLADNAPQVALYYVSIVLGNFVGCNLYRLMLPDAE